MQPYDLMRVALIVHQMRDNSVQWYGADPAEQQRLSAANQALANQLQSVYGLPVVYNPDGGTWRVGSVDGPCLYDLY